MATSNAIKLTSTNKNGGKSFKMGRRIDTFHKHFLYNLIKIYNILNIKCS
jgi:hypothetical protein